MKRKSLLFIVTLVFTVFSLASALASGTETVTTITLKPGPQLGADATLAQVLDTAAIRIHSLPDGYGALVLSLNNTDAFTSLFRLDENGAYVQSAALGVKPLYFSWEDLTKVLMDQLENNPDMSAAGGMMNNDMFKALIDGTMTEEQVMQSMGIDDELKQYVSDLEAAQTVETGSFTLEGSDVADQKTVLTLTKDDIIRALDLQVVRKQMASQLQMNDPSLTEAEISSQVDAQLTEAKKAITDANLNATLTKYTSMGELVGMQFVLNGTSAADMGNAAIAGVNFTVTRTTVDSAKFYQMSMKMLEGNTVLMNQTGSLYVSEEFVSGNLTVNAMNGSPLASADFNLDQANADHPVAQLAVTVFDTNAAPTNSVLIVLDQEKAENVTDTTINAYYTAGGIDVIKADLSKYNLLSVKFNTVSQPDSGFFSALQNASPETSVQLLQMTEDELNAYLQAMQQSVGMTVLTVVNSLPPELSNSLMQDMGVN